MLNEIDKWLSAQSPVSPAIISLLLVAGIGSLDHLIGYEVSFSIFYLFPVCFSAWYLGQKSGFILCLISAVTWLVVDFTSGHKYSHMVIPFWNASVRLGFFVLVVVLLVRLKNSLESHASLAELDGLTGLLNARTFKNRCDTHFLLSARNQRPVTLAYIDLDGFKGVNDSLGHSVGDEVLRAVADTLAKRLRASDISARLGGDEFSILLPDTDYSGAQTFINGLHENLVELAESHHWPVGFSIGVAVFQSPVTSPDQAIRIADALMYQVKHAGKNSVRFEKYN
jgi:diguanylate cyclase (GGDEF)-like protein